jgi:hypothetical protein
VRYLSFAIFGAKANACGSNSLSCAAHKRRCPRRRRSIAWVITPFWNGMLWYTFAFL